MSDRPNVVLVHGAWADGSCWSGVIERLQAAGYTVTAPQFALGPIADDVAKLRLVLGRQKGPTVVAGHSYGGQIITSLAADAPNATALVYVAAFGLDEGESIGALLGQGPPTAALAHLDVDERGYAWLPEEDFVGHFAADVDRTKARVMFAAQQPLDGARWATSWARRPGSRCRRGSWWPRTTRRFRPTPSGCSPRAWARPPPRWHRATWRWCRSRTRSCS